MSYLLTSKMIRFAPELSAQGARHYYRTAPVVVVSDEPRAPLVDDMKALRLPFAKVYVLNEPMQPRLEQIIEDWEITHVLGPVPIAGLPTVPLTFFTEKEE